MGTLLQELGHDVVLLHFIDRVLKKGRKDLFYIVSPATGPKIDIHFWNYKKDEYTSAFNISGVRYIPEFSLRLKFGKDIVAKLNRESDYQTLGWYQKLSQRLNRDLKEFVIKQSNFVEKNSGNLPDIIGVDKAGKETIWAELKFEGFGKKARASVLRQFESAQKRDIPFYLVIPEKPLYGREITNSWIQRNLPSEMKVYKFILKTEVITPKRSQVDFIKVTNRSDL